MAPAQPSHSAAVLSLLPKLRSADCLPSSFTVAHLPGQPSHIIGAAAYVPRLISDELPGFAFHCQVLPAFRRQGAGRALLQHLIQDVRCWEISYLHAAGSFDDGSLAAVFLTSQQFYPCANMHHFMGHTHATLPILTKIVSALKKRKRVPDGFRLKPLEEADLEGVAVLFAQQYATSVARAKASLRQVLEQPVSRELSFVLSNGEQLAGFITAKHDTAIPEVGYWISAPEFRHGWPAAMLLAGFLQAAQDGGISQGRYACNDKTLATLNIARKAGAQLETIRRSYVLDLGAVSCSP